jgi:hypothetical protein
MAKPQWVRVMEDHCDQETIFVVCIDCRAKEEWIVPYNAVNKYLASLKGGDVKSAGSGISDAEATKHFNALGWTVLPTRCPTCAAKAVKR